MKQTGKTKLCALTLALSLIAAGAAFAQVAADEDIPTPPPENFTSGGYTPYIHISAQAMFGAGYNFQNGARGFRNYGGDSDTWVSVGIAFVDSHYNTPKLFQAGPAKDDEWGGKFKIFNYTARLQNWTSQSLEQNGGAWLAEISGRGFHIGFFTQAGNPLGSLSEPTDAYPAQAADDSIFYKPVNAIYAGGKVLNFGDDDMGTSYYKVAFDDPSVTYYTTGDKIKAPGVWYAGYEKPDLFKAYVTALSEGDVNSDVSGGQNDGIAAALDFAVSPFGTATGRRTPFTIDIQGSAIGGTAFDKSDKAGAKALKGNPLGFGLKTEAGVWLGDGMVIAPVVAFDGSKHDGPIADNPGTDDVTKGFDDKFHWKVGGGLTFRFSPATWVADEWDELTGIENYSFRYENNQILKYAYVQAYAAYSEENDLDLLFKVEEPDGGAGFHKQLGAMLEMRLYNVTERNKKDDAEKDFGWGLQGRVSWDFDLNGKLLTPYVRGYFDSAYIAKLRVGAQANLIPRCGFEIAYTSANLNPHADISAVDSWRKGWGNADEDKKMDYGRIELVVVLRSDNERPKTRKRMDEWNYGKYADGSEAYNSGKPKQP